VEFLERNTTPNSEQYVQKFRKLKQRIRRVRQNGNESSSCMITPDQTPVCAQGYLAILEWTVLPHFPIQADLATFDFHFRGLLKDALRGRRFATDDELKHSVPQKLRSFSKGIYATVSQRLTRRWKKCR
jgi:hypothetical protein